MNPINPFARNIYVMAKPAGSMCNLACEYCYYTEKKHLYSSDHRHLMSDDTLELFIRQYIEASMMDSVQFTWHGGEALMRPLDFYRRAMELQERYSTGKHIDNCLQTNVTILTAEWSRFLRENNWLGGISIDGPQEFHAEDRPAPSGKP